MEKSIWKPLCHFGQTEGFSAECYPKFEIQLNHLRNKLCLRDIAHGNETEIDPQRISFAAFGEDDDNVRQFLLSILRVGAGWLRIEAWIHRSISFEIQCVEFYINVKPFQRSSSWSHLAGFYQFIYCFSNVYPDIHLFTGQVFSWRSQSSRCSLTSSMRQVAGVPLSKTLMNRTRCLSKDVYSLKGVPGLSFPMKSREGKSVYINAFTRSLCKEEEGRHGVFEWKISGALVQVPCTAFAHEFIHEVLDRDEDDDEESADKGLPSLVFTQDVDRWKDLHAGEGDLSDGSVIIIQTWSEFQRVRTSEILDADIVVVSIGLYTSEKYSKYLPACIWSVLDSPSQLSMSVDKLLSMESYVSKAGGAYKRSVSRFEIENARHLWQSTKNIKWTRCHPFELGSWDIIVFDEVSALSSTHFEWLRAFDRSVTLGFTTQMPGGNLFSNEWLFMRYGCIDLLSSQVPPFPNPRDILEGCFLQSKPGVCPRPTIEVHKINPNVFESYIQSRTSFEKPSLMTLADIRSNPSSHFSCCSLEEFKKSLEDHYHHEIITIQKDLDKKSIAYREEMGMASRLCALPENLQKEDKAKTEETDLVEEGDEPDTEEDPVRPIRTHSRPRRITGLPRPAPPRAPPTPSSSVEMFDNYEEPTNTDITSALRLVMQRAVQEARSGMFSGTVDLRISREDGTEDGGRVGRNEPSASRQLDFLISEQNVHMNNLLEETHSLEKKLKELRLQWANIKSRLEGFDPANCEEKCAICKFEKADTTTLCFHMFCASCVWRLFSTQSSSENCVRIAPCPVCRMNLSITQAFFIKDCVEGTPPLPVSSMVYSMTSDALGALDERNQVIIVGSSEEEFIQIELSIHYLTSISESKAVVAPFLTERYFGDEPLDMNTVQIFFTTLDSLSTFPYTSSIGHIFTTADANDPLVKSMFLRQFNLTTLKTPHIHMYIHSE